MKNKKYSIVSALFGTLSIILLWVNLATSYTCCMLAVISSAFGKKKNETTKINTLGPFLGFSSIVLQLLIIVFLLGTGIIAANQGNESQQLAGIVLAIASIMVLLLQVMEILALIFIKKGIKNDKKGWLIAGTSMFMASMILLIVLSL